MFRQFVEPGVVKDDEVGGLAVGQPLRHAARGPVGDAERMPARALELRHQLLHRRCHRGADQRLDLGGARAARRGQQREDDRSSEFSHVKFSSQPGCSPLDLINRVSVTFPQPNGLPCGIMEHVG